MNSTLDSPFVTQPVVFVSLFRMYSKLTVSMTTADSLYISCASYLAIMDNTRQVVNFSFELIALIDSVEKMIHWVWGN